MKLVNDFFSFDLSNTNTLISVGSNIAINSKVLISTGNNNRANFFIYKKLQLITGEILTLMYQDYEDENENEEEEGEVNEKIDNKEIINNYLQVLNEKYNFYKNNVMELKKDKLYSFKNMLYDNRKELKKYIRNESTSIIYYLLILLENSI